MFWKKILYYLDVRTLFVRKKPEHITYEKPGDNAVLDEETSRTREIKPNFNLKVMHGINRISIIMFLICLIVMLIKFWPF